MAVSEGALPGTAGVEPTVLGRAGIDTPVLQSGDLEGAAVVGVFFLIGLYFVYSGFRTWQRMRLMQDTPTEKVRSAAVGRTELKGVGRPLGDPFRRPFGDGDCLLATYEIEEWREDHDDEGSSGHWTTVESGSLVGPFQLDDGTGTLRVEPDEDVSLRFEDANEREIRVRPREQEPPEVREFLRAHTDVDVPPSGGITGFLFSEDRKYTERWIPVGADLYLLGATEPVDPDETTSSGLVFRRDTASGEFIVSDRSEADLVAGSKWAAPAKILGGLAWSSAMLYLLLSQFGVA